MIFDEGCSRENLKKGLSMMKEMKIGNHRKLIIVNFELLKMVENSNGRRINGL
jgi:hypothetical protein